MLERLLNWRPPRPNADPVPTAKTGSKETTADAPASRTSCWSTGFSLPRSRQQQIILLAVENQVCLRRAGDVNPLIVGLTKNQGTNVPPLASILTARGIFTFDGSNVWQGKPVES